MAVVAVVIAAFDVYVMIYGGTGTTISHEIIMMSYKYPAFTFLVGFIAGHLFWRVGNTEDLDKIDDRNKNASA